MPTLSNELKAVVVPEDILEVGNSVTQEKCLTVQHFYYRSQRKRDHTGAAYDLSDPVLLDFSIRVNASAQAKPFYSHLADAESFSLTFVFNAVFNATKRLSDYDDAMVVNGYVVDLVEEFQRPVSGDDNEQVTLRVQMLVRNITYMGKESNKTISFIKNNTEL